MVGDLIKTRYERERSREMALHISEKFVNAITKRLAWLPKRAVLPLAAIVVLGVAVTAVAFSYGAMVSIQPETGSLSGNATVVTDANASGGQAMKFGASGGPSCSVTKRTVTASDVTNLKNSGYPEGTQLYVPDGPDPWGGCFPGPSNTGIPSGTTLTAYTGPCTITTPNTAISAKSINCDLSIQASNVTISNSKISTGNISVDSGSLTLKDSEVDFGNNPEDNALVGSNYTVLRANMYGGKRQVWCNNNCTIQDSYLHDQLKDPGGTTHESAARVEQNTTLRHNSLLCNAPNYPPDAGCSANQTGYPDFAAVHDNTMDKNFYLATTGGFCAYGGNSSGKKFSNDPSNGTNVHFTNNVMQRGISPNDRTSIPLSDERRYTCGSYGVTTDFKSTKAGFIFTGNMWDDGLLFANDTTYPYEGFYDE